MALAVRGRLRKGGATLINAERSWLRSNRKSPCRVREDEAGGEDCCRQQTQLLVVDHLRHSADLDGARMLFRGIGMKRPFGSRHEHRPGRPGECHEGNSIGDGGGVGHRLCSWHWWQPELWLFHAHPSQGLASVSWQVRFQNREGGSIQGKGGSFRWAALLSSLGQTFMASASMDFPDQ
jgi:hypothetical protein